MTIKSGDIVKNINTKSIYKIIERDLKLSNLFLIEYISGKRIMQYKKLIYEKSYSIVFTKGLKNDIINFNIINLKTPVYNILNDKYELIMNIFSDDESDNISMSDYTDSYLFDNHESLLPNDNNSSYENLNDSISEISMNSDISLWSDEDINVQTLSKDSLYDMFEDKKLNYQKSNIVKISSTFENTIDDINVIKIPTKAPKILHSAYKKFPEQQINNYMKPKSINLDSLKEIIEPKPIFNIQSNKKHMKLNISKTPLPSDLKFPHDNHTPSNCSIYSLMRNSIDICTPTIKDIFERPNIHPFIPKPLTSTFPTYYKPVTTNKSVIPPSKRFKLTQPFDFVPPLQIKSIPPPPPIKYIPPPPAIKLVLPPLQIKSIPPPPLIKLVLPPLQIKPIPPPPQIKLVLPPLQIKSIPPPPPIKLVLPPLPIKFIPPPPPIKLVHALPTLPILRRQNGTIISTSKMVTPTNTPKKSKIMFENELEKTVNDRNMRILNKKMLLPIIEEAIINYKSKESSGRTDNNDASYCLIM